MHMNLTNQGNIWIFIHIATFGIIHGEEVIKCLTEKRARIRISCPRDHVIYDPIIHGGACVDGTCTLAPSDCTGVTSYIQTQTDRCFWRKRCYIKVRKNDSIPSCRSNVTSSYVTHVIIKQAYCVPKKCIVDMCNTSPTKVNWNPGIIRSHRSYPRSKPKPIKCSIMIPLKSHDTFYMETVSLSGSFPVGLYIQATTNAGMVRTIYTTELVILHGNETASVKVIADMQWKRRLLHGFLIQVAAYRSKHLNAVLQWPQKSRPVVKELGWIRDVKPVVEQCASGQGHMTLTCNADELIYSPAISLSGYSFLKPKCSFERRFKCGGFSADILVQRNACYWKQTCDVTWRHADRIILSKDQDCIGYYASTIGLSGHRCVQKSNIFDVCTTNRSRVDVSWGVIRSHAVYPWYFDDIHCKRVIMIGRRQAGLLIVQDMNLDPDGRDNFTVEHVTKSSSRTVMNIKSSKEGTQAVVRGGKLIIHFKPYKSSKSGRGFILVFRRFHVSKTDFAYSFPGAPSQTSTSHTVLNDAAPVMTHRLSNRRLCSSKGKLRKKGQACNRRVWTDYFIRLE